MTEYPEDIMKAATQLAVDAYTDIFSAPDKIAAAIIAERERCAKVAREWPLAGLVKTNDADPKMIFAIGAQAQARTISKAIMKGGAA